MGWAYAFGSFAILSLRFFLTPATDTDFLVEIPPSPPGRWDQRLKFLSFSVNSAPVFSPWFSGQELLFLPAAADVVKATKLSDSID